MIFGTGIDIIETERVAEKISKEDGFREYVYSTEEIEYCETKAHKHEHYAARFAAKEALVKALGKGFAAGIALNEASVMHDESGKPGFVFSNKSAEFILSQSFSGIHLTISHIKSLACAMVIIEK